MLLELRVENLLLIERAELRLGEGLNALTGETGAGKTVLAHALDLLLGGRPRPGVVRPGAKEAYVEGVFSLDPSLLDDDALADLRERLPEGDDEVVLGRRVSAEGRTRAFVAGRSATAGDLRELGGRLLAFYGQHEHRRLTVASAQLEVLDGFCGQAHMAAREAHVAGHRLVAALAREAEELGGRIGARERDRDLLAFELGEIEELAPSEEEEAALRRDRERLRALDALRAAAGGATEALEGDSGALALLAAGEHALGSSAGADPALDALEERLRGLRLEADDLGSELARYREGLEDEPGRLEEIELRLEHYDRLARKHGGTLAGVLAHADHCRTELERLEGSTEALDAARAALEAARKDQESRAAGLTKARRKAAPALAARVLEELGGLAMEGARFEVALHPREPAGPSGAETVELLIAPNPGVPLAPLGETASGGELSRVMLALMGVASAGGPATLVFDEVDAGIGGQTARAVGERLRRLGEHRQVICITHLPQVASLAQRHFRIEKDAGADVARTSVEQLGGDRLVEELCRMLGSDVADDGARQHAEKLLAAA